MPETDPPPTVGPAETLRIVNDATRAAIYFRTLILTEGVGAFAAAQITSAYVTAITQNADPTKPYE